MTDPSELDTIRAILTSARTAVVTSRGRGGMLHSRPLALLDDGPDGVSNFEGTLWFFTEDPSEKTAEISRHPEVNVSVGDSKGWLSLAGTASLDRDQPRIDSLWNRFADAYFPAGPDDPSVALLRVDVQTAELWDTDQPAPKKAFEIAKVLLTGQEPDLGESRTVEFGDGR